MSLLNAYRDVVANPYAGSGEAAEQNRQRAAAIEEKSKPKGLLGALEDTLAEQPVPAAAPSPAPARPQAIPTDTKEQQVGYYKATEFAEDFGRKAAGAAVGGTLSAPQGIEEGLKGTMRRQLSGESYMIPQAQWADKAMGWLMDATGFRSYADQASDREKALIAFDRFASGVKIPGAAGLANYGREVQGDIESEISEEGKKRLEGSSPTGNIFKGELDFGSNPTLSGYALQAAGVLGSLAPTVATAVITRSPTAAMAVGGSQAAGEGAQNARDYIGNLSDKQLAEVSPYYNTLIENGVPAEEARTVVTDKAAETSAVLQGMVAAVGSRVTGKLLTGAYDDILARVGRNRAGAAAAGAGFSAAEESTQETAEGIASDIGIRSQVSDKEIGENSAANLVLGALGGAPVGAIQGARNTPESALSSYLDRAIEGTAASPGSVERAAVRALDPNRDVALDPQDVRPADGQRAAPIVGVGGTAVPATADAPEALPQGEQAQNLSQSDSPATVDQLLSQSGADLLNEMDAQKAAQATAVQQPVVDPTFTSAVEGIKTDLGLDATENLNLGLVTDNTRLNRFKNALETSFGVKVHFVDFGEQLTTGSGKQLGAFTGYRQGDTILIGANGVDLIDTTWHELTHVLETRHSDVYAQLRDTLVPAMDTTVREQLISSLNARRQAEVGRDLSQQELDSELVAYVVGDLVRSPETMGQMFDSFSDPVAAKTFRDVVMDALQKMLAVIKGPQYIRERARLVEAQKSVTAAFAEFQKRETQKRMAAPAQPAAQATTQPAARPVRRNPFLDNEPTAQPAPSALPRDLAGAKPRFAIGANQFDLDFESDIDKAAFITDGDYTSQPSKRDGDYRAWLRSQGLNDVEIAKRGQTVRAKIKALATGKPSGRLSIPAEAVAVAQPGQFARRTKLQIATRLSEGKPVTDNEMARNPEIAAVRDGVRELIKRAAAVKAKFDVRAKRLAKKHGMQLLAGPIKSEHRAFGKAWFDKRGDFRGLNDIVRSTFVVKDLNDIPAMVDVVLAEFPGSRVRRNGWVNPGDVGETGYRDVFFENVTFDGFRVELQMNLQPMMDAKQSQGHKLYEEETNLTRQLDNPGLSAEQRAEIQAKRADNIARQNAVYSKGYQAVLAATKSLNSASDTRLPSESTRDAETGRGGPTPDVEGPSQAMNPSSGDRETGMPSTLKNDVPSGNDLGNDIVRTPAIPDGNIAQQQAEQNRYRLGIRRAARMTDAEAGLSPDELAALQTDATKKGVPDDVLRRLVGDAVAAKRRFPVAQGWASMFVRGVTVPEGATPADAELSWTPITYKYNVPDGLGRAPQKLNEAWADKVSDEFYKLIKDVYGRAIAGDRNANVILSHKNWYRNVTEVLRREFGATGDLLADLLGATSPNTPVDTNWQFSIDILRRFVRGDFNEDMKKFAQYVADGGRVSDYPSEEKIRQISGKLYGMNSSNAMLALLNTWRQIHPGQAPKARNFALNLIGQSSMATIDVWAARMLRRAANIAAGGNAMARIPPPAEKGVTGDWNSKATAVTGEFGFGARVMDIVVERLRAEGIDVTAPDLQAIAWFTEKELWSKNNWTSAQGEGGSFEENIEGMPMERYLAGWSIQQGEAVPEAGASSLAQARVMTALKMDGSVIAARVMPTKGLYGGTVEQSFDTEWTAEKGKHDPSLVLAEISQIAKDNSQYDIFVSKVLKPEEASENARPGVEIYFRDQQALDAAMPVLERFTSQGVDGFTMAVDPRAEGGSYIGVRLQYIPEISMRWDEEFRASALTDGFIENALQQKLQQLNDITSEVSQMDGVAFAKTYQYDTIVVGKENYDAFIDRAAASGDRQTRNEVWFGEPIRSAVERAAARLNRDAGQVDAGRVQDASRPEPGSVGQFSRQLVELAANQDPRAPKLFGISETPTVLRAVGGPSQLLVIEPRTVAKVVNPQFTGRVTEEGGMRRNAAGLMVPAAARIPLTVDELRSVPAMIADPVAVIRSDGGTMTRRYGYKVILDMVKNGNPVVAIVHPDVRYGSDRASEIASVYPVNEGNSLAETNRELNGAQLLYFNKGKATVLAGKIGNKLPSITKITPPLAKNPGSVPNRTLPPIKGSNFSRRVAIPGQRFTLPARTLREKYLENLFENRMSRVEDVQQAVEQQGGTLDIRDAQGNVVGSTDISSASQRMRGAVRGRLDRFKKEVEIPLIEDAAKAGVNLEEVAQYLYAVYAPERNAIIQQRNPTQFATDGGSGMTNAEAAQIVGTFRARRDFAEIERIARRFQNITRMTQNILLDEGLVEPQVIAQWRNYNPNYVPLRGFENVDEETGNPLGVGSPGRLDPRNPFVKVAKGRETKAGQIIENILKDYTDAVVLAEKNRVNRLLLQFVRDNADPTLWQINAPTVSRSYYRGGMTPLGYAQGTVRIAFEVNENPAETIAVRVNGRPVFIRVKDPAMLEDMQMAGAIGSGDQARLYFRVWSGMMQTLAKLRTTLSPAFVFIDAIRNTETGGFWNLVKYGPKTAAKAYARLFKAARVAWKAERDGTWQGNTDTITIREPGQPARTVTLKEAYDMYRADGGKVGYLDIKEIEDIQKDIQQRFRAAQAAGSLDPRTYGTQMLGVVNKVEDLMLDAAGSIETAMRFATYMARLEAGSNRQQATDAAKNVTVNFDRKGKWTPHLGLLYMFANANIQGTRATYNLIFKSGKAGALLGGSLIGLGYAIAQLGSAAAGDDDEPYWDKKLYKQSKIKNLVFFTAEGDTVTIPMAYGSGFFVNLGYALSDLQRGVPLAKVGAFMRDSFFTHFSPFGSLENPLTFATPTLLDPIAVVTANMTEQGIPLMPDSSFEPNKPDSEKFWAATRGTMFQQLSRAMNDATGGTQGRGGGIDVSPETLRYGFGFLTGGAGGFVRDAADSILLTTEIGLDSALEKNKIPILRSFYQQNTGKQNQSEFYENADTAVGALDEWKVLYGTEKIREEPTRDRLRESRRVIALGAAVDEYKKSLAALRYQEVAIVDRRTSGDLTAAEAEERLARVAERKNRLYVQFNRAFYKADPNTPE